MFLTEVIFIAVEHPSGPLQQRVGSGKTAIQLTDMVDSQRVVTGPRHTGVDPRSGAVAHERHGIVQRRAGDTGVYRRGGQLGEGAGKGRAGVGLPRWEKVEGIDRKIIGQYGTAGGSSLTEARPVIDHRQPRAVLWHKGELGAIVSIQRQNANPVGIQ